MARESCRRILRRARPTLIFVGLGFLVLHVLGWLAFLRWPCLRDPLLGEGVRRLEVRLPRSGPRPYLVIALGSSRTQNGFNPAHAEPILREHLARPVLVHNLAVPGGGALQAYLAWHRLRAAGITPDLILQEVSSISLQQRFDRPESVLESHIFNPRRLMPDERAVAAEVGIVHPDRDCPWREYLVPAWYTYRAELQGRCFPDLVDHGPRQITYLTADRRGWAPCPLPDAVARRAEWTDVARRGYKVNLSVHTLCPLGTGLLRRLCTEAHDAGVPVILVRYPEGTTFRSWYPPRVREAVTTWFVEFAKHPSRRAIDAWEWYDDEPFADSHHLLAESAAPYTRRLIAEHVVPLLTPDGKLR
jgi:hypothetical protein